MNGTDKSTLVMQLSFVPQITSLAGIRHRILQVHHSLGADRRRFQQTRTGRAGWFAP
jgi:hypothetical protein